MIKNEKEYQAALKNIRVIWCKKTEEIKLPDKVNNKFLKVINDIEAYESKYHKIDLPKINIDDYKCRTEFDSKDVACKHCPVKNQCITLTKEKIDKERNVEKAIHKALSDLQIFTGMYIGERQVKRGDCISAKELWKKFKDKFKWQLTDNDKLMLKTEIRSIINEFGMPEGNRTLITKRFSDYVYKLLESRDERFKSKRKLPNKIPTPYPNQL